MEVKEGMKRYLNGLVAKFHHTEIEKLECRLQKCKEKDGVYVENRTTFFLSNNVNFYENKLCCQFYKIDGNVIFESALVVLK